jgi:hypothetical protein
MEHDDLLWLAGLLEGEGTFHKGPPCKPNSPVVRVQMVDEDVIARAAMLMDTPYLRRYTERHRTNGLSPAYEARLTGGRAVALMKRLRPLMGERRRRQIEEAVASYNPDWRFRKVDRRNREEIRRLADKGDKTQNEIAALFGISRTTVSLIKNRFGRYAD